MQLLVVVAVVGAVVAGLFASATQAKFGWVVASFAAIGAVWAGAAAAFTQTSSVFTYPGTLTEPPGLTGLGWALVAAVTLSTVGLLVAGLWVGASGSRKSLADLLSAARKAAVAVPAGSQIEQRVFTEASGWSATIRGEAARSTMRYADGWVHVYTEAGDVLFAGPVGQLTCAMYDKAVVVTGPAGLIRVAAHPLALHARAVVPKSAIEPSNRLYAWVMLAVEGLHDPAADDLQLW